MSVHTGLRQIRLHAKAFTAVCLAAAIVAIMTAAVSGATPKPSRGPIPEAAFRPGQPLDMSLVPDFVPAIDRDGNVAGYVPKEALAPPPRFVEAEQLPDLPTPVYGEDLRTVVGHMVPGKGFVPLGTDRDSIPNFEMSAAPVP